jgi:hypothetical protein
MKVPVDGSRRCAARPITAGNQSVGNYESIVVSYLSDNKRHRQKPSDGLRRHIPRGRAAASVVLRKKRRDLQPINNGLW